MTRDEMAQQARDAYDREVTAANDAFIRAKKEREARVKAAQAAFRDRMRAVQAYEPPAE